MGLNKVSRLKENAHWDEPVWSHSSVSSSGNISRKRRSKSPTWFSRTEDNETILMATVMRPKIKKYIENESLESMLNDNWPRKKKFS